MEDRVRVVPEANPRYQSGRLDLNRPNMSSAGKLNEKELMHGLNDRLAGFIQKVHQLEEHNHLLEREIGELRGKAKPASCLEEEYGPELRRLRQLVQDITLQKHHIEIEHENLEEELSSLKRQQTQEKQTRSEAESGIVLMKKDMSDAYQAKLQLDRKAQSLLDEIQFLKSNHEAEVSEMFEQIQDSQQVNVKALEFGHPGVTAALRDIRTQLEGHAASDVQRAGESFRSQFARLTKAAETKRETLKATQQEIQEYRRRLQAKNIELDCAKGTREALEKQLHDVEDRHKEELIHYQNTTKELENELINCKFDMSGYLREYQDLLNVKMALDVEILSYRKLLCGEEARLSMVPDASISLPHIYRQSPVYSLPCFSRPGATHRRAEPQYKFVEEIITETTREIEMSEFEDTGSEGTDEQESTKSKRGGNKEESDHKDSGGEEGNQMSDSQQGQVEFRKSEDEDDTRDQKDPGEEEESEQTAEPDADGNIDTDKKTHDKFILSENLDKKESENQAAAERKDEKETAWMTGTNQRMEAESLVKSEDDKRASDEEGKKISAQDMKHADESTARVPERSGETQQLSNGVQVRDEVVSETHQRGTEAEAEEKSSPSAETGGLSEEHKVTSTLKEEKSHTEQKGTSEGTMRNDEDIEAKRIQDVEL